MRLCAGRKPLFGSLRGRLVLAVATVHAVMMSLFILDLTAKQRESLFERQELAATSLAQSLSTSAAVWIVSDDVAGLQELVESQRRYPELAFAILADESGLILAHTDGSKVGKYLLDLPQRPLQTTIGATPIIDVAAPAFLGGKLVGWARIGVGQGKARTENASAALRGALYALAAATIGSSIAYLLGRSVTRRLDLIQLAIGDIRKGAHMARCPTSGSDEAASLARAFNGLLDALDERNADLVRSEERYRTLLRNVRTAVVVHGPDTRILTANAEAQVLLGLTEEQMLGKAAVDPAWSFLREDGTALPIEEYPVTRTLAARAPIDGAVIGLRRPDRDGVSWVLANTAIARRETGEIGEIIVTFVDMTERKRSEEERRDRVIFLECLDAVDRAIQGAVDLEPMMDGVFGAMLPFFGSDVAWLLYADDPAAPSWRIRARRSRREHPWAAAERDPIPASSGIQSIFQAARESKGPVSLGAGSGNPVPAGFADFAPAASLIAVAVEPKGYGPHLLGMHWDSSPRASGSECNRLFLEIGRRLSYALAIALSRRDLQDSEIRYREIFENVSDAIEISEIAEDGRMRSLDRNPAWMSAFEDRRDADMGADPETRGRYEGCLESGAPVAFESEVDDGTGIRHFRSTIIPIRDDAGRIYRMLEARHDITGLKRAETDLNRLNEELERRVRWRIEEADRKRLELRESQIALMNIVEDLNEKTAELERANAKLRELDRLKSMFIASMSHELRTPLNSIIGFSSILLAEWNGSLTEEQKESVATVNRSGKHLLSLINDVLDVSKLEAGTIVSIPEEFDLGSALSEAVASIRTEADKKDLELRVSAPSLSVNADRRRLLQCILNLAGNAIKYTDRGSIEVSARLSPDRLAVDIAVEDSGIGIREEDIGRLFAPFTRLGNGPGNTIPGTGLGLYLTRKLVKEILKGEISVTSAVGRGSRFEIRLPVSAGRGTP